MMTAAKAMLLRSPIEAMVGGAAWRLVLSLALGSSSLRRVLIKEAPAVVRAAFTSPDEYQFSNEYIADGDGGGDREHDEHDEDDKDGGGDGGGDGDDDGESRVESSDSSAASGVSLSASPWIWACSRHQDIGAGASRPPAHHQGGAGGAWLANERAAPGAAAWPVKQGDLVDADFEGEWWRYVHRLFI